MTKYQTSTIACAVALVAAVVGLETNAWANFGVQDFIYKCYHNGDYYGWTFAPQVCEQLHGEDEEQEDLAHPGPPEKLPYGYNVVHEKHNDRCIIEGVEIPIW